MNTTGSIFTRALELQAEARKRGDTSKDKEDALKVASEVETSEKLLEALQDSLEVLAALRAQQVEVDPGPIDTGLANFERHAGSGGLPSRRAVQSANNQIRDVQKRVRDALGTAWRKWSGEVINQLPTDRLALMGQGRAAPVNRALEDMRTSSFQVPAVSTAIANFVHNRDLVNRGLSAVEDPGPHLREVLKQLQEGTTLDQLTDDDIAVLRERGWATNVFVKRADLD